jgi:hypothetical protein
MLEIILFLDIQVHLYIPVLLFEGTFFHHSSQIKSLREVTKQEKSMVFLLLLLDDGRIRIRLSEARIRIRSFD